MLAQGERTVDSLATEIGLSLANASQHFCLVRSLSHGDTVHVTDRTELPLRASFNGAQVDLTTLGADDRAVFRTVILPLVRPYLISGYAFAFVLSLNEYIVAFMVSGSKKRPPSSRKRCWTTYWKLPGWKCPTAP